MMNEIELKISQQLAMQMEIYGNALPLAEALARAYDASPEQQSNLSKLEEVMNDAMTQNHHLTTLMNQVPDVKRLSQPTRDDSSKLAERIATMIELFDRIETRAKRVKENLMPELNQSLQARKMKTAYGNA